MLLRMLMMMIMIMMMIMMLMVWFGLVHVVVHIQPSIYQNTKANKGDIAKRGCLMYGCVAVSELKDRSELGVRCCGFLCYHDLLRLLNDVFGILLHSNQDVLRLCSHSFGCWFM